LARLDRSFTKGEQGCPRPDRRGSITDRLQRKHHPVNVSQTLLESIISASRLACECGGERV